MPNQVIGGYVLLDSEGLPRGSVSYDFLAGFGLSKTSLAIDAGTHNTITEMPLVDFQNTALNASSMLDIGPFESSAPLAVNKYTENKKVVLFPNPVSDKLNIEIESGSKLQKISLYDSLGKLIVVVKDPKKELYLNDLHIQKGFYFVKLEGDFGVVLKKIVKE